MHDQPLTKTVTVSIVSHGQGYLVDRLLPDVAECCEVARLILTYNLPEKDIAVPEPLTERLLVRRNSKPHGFGANHNAAFRHCDTPFFCVLNPDIRISKNPFPMLLGILADECVSLCAPMVLDPEGHAEDSARCFPTPLNLLSKAFGISNGRCVSGPCSQVLRPDWLAGMFMLFRSKHFAAVNGFDEKFYLYYEDIDICARLRNSGFDLVLCPQVTVIHDARRTSRRNPRYMAWHLQSIIRYFVKHLGRLPAVRSD